MGTIYIYILDMKKQFRQVTGIHVYSVVPYDPKVKREKDFIFY